MTAVNNSNRTQMWIHGKTADCTGSEKHFAAGLNGYKLFWVFVFGSVMGFMVETLWCLVKNGCFEVRSSFVFGPFNAIYGIGAVVLYVGLSKVRKNNTWVIFIFGMVAGTVVEHICSWIQEAALGTVSWDYSQLPLNIGGRVCLLYSAFWGILAIIWVKCLHPFMEKLIAKIPNSVGKPLTAILLVVFLILAVVSIAAVSRWMMRMDGIPPMSRIGMLCDQYFNDAYLEIIYPNMSICN